MNTPAFLPPVRGRAAVGATLTRARGSAHEPRPTTPRGVCVAEARSAAPSVYYTTASLLHRGSA